MDAMSVELRTVAGTHAVVFNDGFTVHWQRFSDRQQAENAVTAISLMIEDEDALTVSEFLERWIELHVLYCLQKATGDTYLRCIREAVDYMGSRRLDSIRRNDIRTYVEQKRSEGLTERQIKVILEVWSSAFSTAVRWHYIKLNPLRHTARLVK